ncbi:serine hydrolase domain-containing protein [Roseivirga sp. 4D4]|uniref:serine hydrolase domain-containing protein n=1 Tax=Roseivirga sp. 4D4 TaxID=1889784 RepID=UPI0014817A93|nr:serine hydrolase domain-containing protein [Roseivirga sp. 4D4]
MKVRIVIPSVKAGWFFSMVFTLFFSCSATGQDHWREFDSSVEKLILDEVGAGAEIYIERAGTKIYHRAFGFSDPELKVKSQIGDIYNIRSMTKPMAGAIAEILFERNELSPDDLVSKYLPEFGHGKTKGLTIEHLLLHRGGYTQGQPGKSWTRYNSLKEMVDYWADNDPTGKVGGTWSYADAHSDIFARVAEVVTGLSAQELLEDYLIGPLRMTSSFAAWTSKDKLVKRIVPQLRGKKGDWKVVWRAEDYPWHKFAMFAQSVYSTAEDYAKFARLYMPKRSSNLSQVISNNSVKRAFSNRQLINVTPQLFPLAGKREFTYGHFWGMAFNDLEDEWPEVFLHRGSDGTSIHGFPAKGIIIVVMTQSRGSNLPNNIESAIQEIIIPELSNY